jgi:hypothetical protein
VQAVRLQRQRTGVAFQRTLQTLLAAQHAAKLIQCSRILRTQAQRLFKAVDRSGGVMQCRSSLAGAGTFAAVVTAGSRRRSGAVLGLVRSALSRRVDCPAAVAP